jgi:hypothetical protein
MFKQTCSRVGKIFVADTLVVPLIQIFQTSFADSLQTGGYMDFGLVLEEGKGFVWRVEELQEASWTLGVSLMW